MKEQKWGKYFEHVKLTQTR